MYGLNTFSLLAFIGILYFVSVVSKSNKKTQNRTIILVSLGVLALNLLQVYNDPTDIPVEFSTVSYYIVPIIMLSRIKKIQIWAVYAGLMAGFFYYSTMILAGGKIYELYPHVSVYKSLFCHGSLLYIGLLKLKTTKYQMNESYKIIIGLIIMVSWALYIRPEITSTGRIFIYELLDAVYIKSIMTNNLQIGYLVYYIVLGYLVIKSSKWIFKLNIVLHKKYQYKLIKMKRYDLLYN